MLEGQYVVAEDEEEEVEVVQFSLRKLVPTRKKHIVTRNPKFTACPIECETLLLIQLI